jgi:hypothetical protein
LEAPQDRYEFEDADWKQAFLWGELDLQISGADERMEYPDTAAVPCARNTAIVAGFAGIREYCDCV